MKKLTNFCEEDREENISSFLITLQWVRKTMERFIIPVLLCLPFSPCLMADYTGAVPDNSQSCTEIADNPLTAENEAGFRCTGQQYDTTVLLSDSDIEDFLKEILPSWGTTTPGAFLDDPKFLLQPELGTINAHHAYARGLSGQGVTIAIEDSGLDITNIDFLGKIQHEGASLVYWRPLAFFEESESFSECANPFGKTCRVFEINAGGDYETIQDFARRIIENLGHPSNNNTWFIRDTSQDDLFAWYEFPALYDEREGEGMHGTTVASVAAGWLFGVAPGSHIVPLSINFDEQDEVQIVVETILNDPTLLGVSPVEFDRLIADSVKDNYANYDIINRSYGSGSSDWDLHVQAIIDSINGWSDFKINFPRWSRALMQLDVPEAEKTIEVWAAGNEGQFIPSAEATFPFYEPNVRGHVIAVTALGIDGHLAPYANQCGYLPDNWNTAEHGRHYCLAAPGTVNAIAPGALAEGFSEDIHAGIVGTSFAAPMFSGALALVMQKFRQQLTPREIALRVINTANNSGEYGRTTITTDSETGEQTVWYPYGAGLLDLKAATEPVSALRTGTAAIQAPMAYTSLQTPPAWGNVGRQLTGVEVAGFDDWNAPFWYEAQHLVNPFDSYHTLPLPHYEQTIEQSSLLPYLTWHNVGRDRQDPAGSGMKLRMTATYAMADVENQWGGVIYPTFGFSAEFRPGVRGGFLMETDSHHGSRPRGAFGRRVSSQLVWLTREKIWDIDADGQWQLEAAALLAGGRPDYADGAMFHAGGALYSAGHVSLRHRAVHTQTTLTLSQPLRAESGTGTLHYPSGRDLDGEWQFAQQDFSLIPASREIRVQLRHNRPLVGGKLAIEFTRAHNAGHIAGRSRTHLGLGYHLQW